MVRPAAIGNILSNSLPGELCELLTARRRPVISIVKLVELSVDDFPQ